MPGKRAKILSITDVGDLLVYASCTRHPLRNTLIVLLSAKAGFRAGEIANLTWDMVVDANGNINGLIELHDAAAKKCSGRSIPIHPDLSAALIAWQQVAPQSDFVITSERGGRMQPLSIVLWFSRAFKNIGLKGCSSHSGRRTFVTRAARIVHKAGGSLRDVQLLAGHRSIQTTRGGCADIIQTVAEHIDARQFNPSFPKIFPRFVQHAIWQYCSQSGLDICNGNQIDDRRRCRNESCRVRLMCDRVALRRSVSQGQALT
jgi:integrase/recombinase XerD